MAEYKVKRDYKAIYSAMYGEEVALCFRKGEVVEVAPEVAEWVERDSAGTLVLVAPPDPPEGGTKRALNGPGRDRQVKGASKR